MLLLLLIYVVLMALWKIDVYLINTLVDNKSLFKLRFFNTDQCITKWVVHVYTMDTCSILCCKNMTV